MYVNVYVDVYAYVHMYVYVYVYVLMCMRMRTCICVHLSPAFVQNVMSSDPNLQWPVIKSVSVTLHILLVYYITHPHTHTHTHIHFSYTHTHTHTHTHLHTHLHTHTLSLSLNPNLPQPPPLSPYRVNLSVEGLLLHRMLGRPGADHVALGVLGETWRGGGGWSE